MLALSEVLQLKVAEVNRLEGTYRRVKVIAGHFGYQDLTTMCGGANSSCPVHAQTHISGFGQVNRSRVDTHAHTHIAVIGPPLQRQRPLREYCSFDRLVRFTEYSEKCIAIASDQATRRVVDGL